MAVPTELIASTMILPELTPGPGLQTVAPCTLSIPGHWAGPVTSEIELLLGHFIAIDLLLTKAFTTFCVFTEIKSINESYHSVTGVNVWDRFVKFLKRSKEQMEYLK
jgi:hypothetical protein